MARSATLWTALLAGSFLACSPVGGSAPEPPRPAGLSGFHPNAVRRIEEALATLDADHTRASAWAELGFVYGSERLKDLGLQCFQEASRLDPEQPRWPYREAILQAHTGSFMDAIAAMERSLEIEPGYPPSHARLGDYHLALGDLDAAGAAYREAARLDSSYPGGWIGCARVALQRDQAREAIEILERLQVEDPEEPVFRQLLECARRQEGEGGPGDTVVTLDGEGLAVWNDPWELEARSYLRKPDMLEVVRLLQEGRAAQAMALLEEERESGGDPLDTALTVASAHLQLGHPDLALREIDALLKREPENIQALLMRLDLMDDSGDVSGAVELLERVNVLQPTFGGAFAAKAYKLAQLGSHEAALSAFERAMELGEADIDLRVAHAGSLIALKRWPEAESLLAALVAEQPRHGEAWLQLAIARLRSASFEGADEALERARATGDVKPNALRNVEDALNNARARHANKSAGDDPR